MRHHCSHDAPSVLDVQFQSAIETMNEGQKKEGGGEDAGVMQTWPAKETTSPGQKMATCITGNVGVDV